MLIRNFTLVAFLLFPVISLAADKPGKMGYIFINSQWISYDASRLVDIRVGDFIYRVHPGGQVETRSAQLKKEDIKQPFASMLDIGEPIIQSEYNDIIIANSLKNNVDANLVRAIIHQESRYDPRALSHKKAAGLMQLIPATAERFGAHDVFDPSQNVTAGTRYLAHLLDLFKGDVSLAVAAYNAGENAVIGHGGIPPYKETQNYVSRVLALWSKYAFAKNP